MALTLRNKKQVKEEAGLMFYKKIVLTAVLAISTGVASAAINYPPAVPTTDLEAFFGTASGGISAISPGDGTYIDSATEGSGIKDSFGFVIGDVISFDYNFMTDELPPDFVNDYAFVSIGGQVSLLDHVLGSPTSASDYYYRETGYKSFSYLSPVTGILDFGIGIVDVADNVVDSALLIDNIRVTRDSSTVYEDGFEVFDPEAIGDVSTGEWFNNIQPTEGYYQTLITTASGVAPVPLPPAAWLLFSGIAVLMGFGKSQRSRKPI